MKTSRHSILLKTSRVAILPTLILACIAGMAFSACSMFCSPLDGVRAGGSDDLWPCREDTACFSRPGISSIETGFNLCMKQAGPGSKAESWWLIQRLDIFVFFQDGVQALDSYSRTYTYSTSGTMFSSSTGRRKVVIVANSHMTDNGIEHIYSYEDLAASVSEFTSDSPLSPVMTGEAEFIAGTDRKVSVTLGPIMSQIEVASVKCDMKGAWAGHRLQNVKLYITGMSNRTGLLEEEDFQPAEILNHGAFVEEDMRRLNYSGMSYKYLGNGTRQGNATSYGNAALYCYPNTAKEESIGSPFTKLVIEGTMDGKTYYYPIPVNRPGYGWTGGKEGIGRNVKYVLDITLTRPGSDDPDTPVGDKQEITEGTFELHPGNLVTGNDGESVHIWVDVDPEGIPVEIDEDDLDFDRERGIYDYTLDPDGHGVTLKLLRGGAGTFSFSFGPPINDIAVVIIIVNP